MRHKNTVWKLNDPPGMDGAQLAVLMDIRDELQRLAVLMDVRDELQRLNDLLHCPNFVNIPRELRGLRRDVKGGRRKSA